MSTIHSRSRGRAGMTLIEILVVIAIIAILAGLLLAAVVGVFSKGYEAQARSEMLNLSGALTNFYKDKKFYPPSQIKLCKNFTDYGVTALDIESLTYIAAMWPQLGQFTNIPWGGATPVPATGFILNGDQCLVFFLGGPPTGIPLPPNPPTPLYAGDIMPLLGGFSTNPQDPVYLGPYTPTRKQLDRKQYFDFPAARLYLREANDPFPSFQDAWPSDTWIPPAPAPARPPSPYVYFSAGKLPNGYDPTQTITFPVKIKGAITPFTVAPYVQTVGPPSVYYNSKTYQIISAGPNGQFGPGGAWPPTQTVVFPAPVGTLNPGLDDFSNFSGAQLGAGVTN